MSQIRTSTENPAYALANPIKVEHAVIPQISEEEMQEVYNWVDSIPLSRPKKNIARDFSDCVLIAEVIKHFCPHLVELHNYSNASSIQQKANNWNTMNQKVLKKLNLQLSPKDIKDAVEMVPEAIERILLTLRFKIDQYLQRKKIQKRSESAGKNLQNLQQMNEFITQHPFQNNHQINMAQQYNQQFIAAPQQMMNQPMSRPPLNPSIIQNNPVNHENNQYSDQKYNNQRNYGNQDGYEQLLAEKDNTIGQLRETVEILELKIKKLEQLVKLKDSKINNLQGKLNAIGIM